MRRKARPDGFRNLTSIIKRDILVWTDRDGEPRSAPADRGATKLNMHTAQLSRQPAKYQHRKHYEGFYWFSGTQAHVWHESMAEYTALMWWDHHRSIEAIASQPMCIIFADGTRHFPDFFAVHSDGSQVLYDVRPSALLDEKAIAQFEKTRQLCTKTGWNYEVFTGLDRVIRHNLEWMSAFRQKRFEPDDVLVEYLRL